MYDDISDQKIDTFSVESSRFCSVHYSAYVMRTRNVNKRHSKLVNQLYKLSLVQYLMNLIRFQPFHYCSYGLPCSSYVVLEPPIQREGRSSTHFHHLHFK